MIRELVDPSGNHYTGGSLSSPALSPPNECATVVAQHARYLKDEAAVCPDIALNRVHWVFIEELGAHVSDRALDCFGRSETRGLPIGKSCEAKITENGL